MTDQPQRPQPGYAVAPRRLARSRDDRWVAGVCGGIARYTGIDANVVRLLVVLGTVLGFGALLLAYVVAWVLLPKEPDVPAWGPPPQR